MSSSAPKPSVPKSNPPAARKPATSSKPAVSVPAPHVRPAGLPTDEELHTAVHEQLNRLGPVIRNVSVTVHSGRIVLDGSVGTPHERLMILQLVRRIGTIQSVQDRLQVRAVVRRNSESSTDGSGLPVRGIAIAGAVILLGLGGWWLRSGNTAHASGLVKFPAVVQFGGQPAAGAFLTLHTASQAAAQKLEGEPAANITPQGRAGADGGIEWSTFDRGDGVPPGEYIVTATWNRTVVLDGEQQPGPNLLPEKYQSPATSPLRLTVTSESPSPWRLDLR